jgi:hypothetical protein
MLKQRPKVDVDLATAELRSREPIFHRPETLGGFAGFETMAAADFWEVGASGRVYGRDEVMKELAQRYADAAYEPLAGLAVADFVAQPVGGGVWLVTYALRQGNRQTRRLSVWRRTREDWRLLYHQGTVIQH